MSYFPVKVTKFFDSFDSEIATCVVRSLGQAILESLPGPVLAERIQIMTAHGMVEDVSLMSIAAVSGRIETFISDPSFRYLAWWLDLGEGSVGWKIRLSPRTIPSVTFECDLLAAEGKHPSENEIANYCESLIVVRHGDVLETSKGYYGYPEFVFLRYNLQRDESFFETYTCAVNTPKLKAYISTASSKGINWEVPIRVSALNVERWARNTAQKLAGKEI